MAQLISEIWEGLRNAGIPEVMLFMADNTASRCHWDDTAVINEVRVALLADQDRQIVRVQPVDACVGIGVASPKGIDPSGYKLLIQKKLRVAAGGEPEPEPASEPEPEPVYVPAPAPVPPPVAVAPAPPPPDALTSRFGVAMKPAQRYGAAVPR